MKITRNKTFLLLFLYLYNGIQFSADSWEYHHMKTGQKTRAYPISSFSREIGLPQGPSRSDYKPWTKESDRR